MRGNLLVLAILLRISSPLLAAEDSLIFSDDFSTLRPGWGKADENRSVNANWLMLKPPTDGTFVQLYQGAEVGNADIRAYVTQTQGGTDQPGGIVFWAADYGNYYAALVESDGTFLVVRRMNRRFLYPVTASVRDELKKGTGQLNLLRVVTTGNLATIYLNDKQVTAFRGFPPFGTSKVGVHVESGKDPYTWGFSAFSVRKGQAPADNAVPQDDSLLFADDFSTFDPAWGTANAAQKVADNKLIENLDAEKIRHMAYQGSVFGDADIRVNVSESKGNADQPGGIMFWGSDRSNYYAALVQPDGNFYVARFAGNRTLYPVFMTVRDEVRKGLGETNSLRVVTSGNTATIYANDKQLTKFKGFPPAGASFVGVHAESGTDPATWAFSDFSIRKGPAPSEEPSTDDDSLLFADDFSTLDPSWTTASDIISVGDNKLTFNMRPQIAERILYRGRLFGDADIRLKISALKGNLDQPAGIVFWAADVKNYYTANIQPDGGFYVTRNMDNASLLPYSMLTRDEVLKGLGQENVLRVVTSGNRATIYVNDKQLTTFRGFPPAGGSQIGVRAESGTDPSVWALSNLTVRQGPPPSGDAVSQDNTLLFADDFSRFDPGWGASDESINVSDSQLVLNVKPKTAHRVLYQGNLFGDADLRLKVTQNRGESGAPAGLVFWGTNIQNYFLFAVQTDGTAFIGQTNNGKWTINTLNPADGTINQGLGQVNELRVVARGKSAVLYVNDRDLATFTHGPAEVGGKIGVHAEATQEPSSWAFSNLTVRKVQ